VKPDAVRLGSASAAVALALGLTLWPVLRGPEPTQLVVPGAVGTALVALAVAGLWPRALAWGLGLVGVEYVVSLLLVAAPPDLAAPLFGLAWLLAAELGWAALEARTGERPWTTRILATAAVATLGTICGWGLLLVALLPLPGGPLLTALGVAAAIVAAGVLLVLARASRAD
jgi:hypothetical protein